MDYNNTPVIPTEEQCKMLWDKYHLPDAKQQHVSLVARVAMFIAGRLIAVGEVKALNLPLILAAALLHDIDKSIPKLSGERHPDAAVRVLRVRGMDAVANIVKTHSVHSILDPSISPKSWEEKIVFLADKMVKNEVITVDKRFALWRDEHLPLEAQKILDACYPKVKALESELCSKIGIEPEDVANLV